MNKRHLLFVLILAVLCYYFLNLFFSTKISFVILAVIYIIAGIFKSKNFSKSVDYCMLSFIASILLLILNVRFTVVNGLSLETILTGLGAVFCGSASYLIYVDETDNYRLNLKNSKYILFTSTAAFVAIYFTMF